MKNSKFLSTDVITEFRGRGDEIRIYPLNFREFVSAYDGTEDEAWDNTFVYGGLPLILSMRTVADKALYLSLLFQKVYLSDIIGRNRIKNIEVPRQGDAGTEYNKKLNELWSKR